MKKISSIDRVRNDEVFIRIKDRNILTWSKNKEG